MASNIKIFHETCIFVAELEPEPEAQQAELGARRLLTSEGKALPATGERDPWEGTYVCSRNHYICSPSHVCERAGCNAATSCAPGMAHLVVQQPQRQHNKTTPRILVNFVQVASLMPDWHRREAYHAFGCVPKGPSLNPGPHDTSSPYATLVALLVALFCSTATSGCSQPAAPATYKTLSARCSSVRASQGANLLRFHDDRLAVFQALLAAAISYLAGAALGFWILRLPLPSPSTFSDIAVTSATVLTWCVPHILIALLPYDRQVYSDPASLP